MGRPPDNSQGFRLQPFYHKRTTFAEQAGTPNVSKSPQNFSWHCSTRVCEASLCCRDDERCSRITFPGGTSTFARPISHPANRQMHSFFSHNFSRLSDEFASRAASFFSYNFSPSGEKRRLQGSGTRETTQTISLEKLCEKIC
jgi:hypothetical protein